MTSSNARITKGANPYVSAPAAPCSTSTTLITKSLVLSNDFIVFAHAAVGQNRIGFVKPEGYATAGDCTQAQAAPNANSFPSALAYDKDNKVLFVAYSGNATTRDINSIYAYTLNEAPGSVSISAINKIYDASLYGIEHSFLLYEISDMIYDTVDKKLFVATAVNTATTILNFSIEKLNYDFSLIGTSNNSVLTRTSTSPFKPYNSDTKCISAMMID